MTEIDRSHSIRLVSAPFDWPGWIAVCNCREFVSLPMFGMHDAERAGRLHVQSQPEEQPL